MCCELCFRHNARSISNPREPVKTLDILTSNGALAVVLFPGKGRGVVALRPFAAGELVERAPVITVPASDVPALTSTALGRYYFEWGPDDDQAAVALGYGSLYNHSYEPNAAFEFREDEHVIEFLALRAIAAGEELTVNYNNLGELAANPLGFDVR